MDSADILKIEFETLFFKDAVEVLPSFNNPWEPTEKVSWVNPDEPLEIEDESFRIEIKDGGVIDFSNQ